MHCYKIFNNCFFIFYSFKMTVTEPGDAPITVQPSNEPKRRVSIASDPVSESRLAYDNLGYDLYPRRKISQVNNAYIFIFLI